MRPALDPTTVFVWVAAPLGLLLVVLTPPFQIPDEPNHFARAFQISDGAPVSRRTSDSVGGWLPRSIHELTTTVMGKVPFHPEVKQDFGAWARSFEIPLAPGDRIETAFPNTALSGPVAYVPQALGIAIGRRISSSTLAVFYWGRITSLLLCVVITALAIKWLSVRRWTCVLLSLLPMALFLRSSVSSDGPTLALTILAFAICLRPIAGVSSRDNHLTPDTGRKQPWLLSVIAALLALGKPPYAAVTFLALAAPQRLVGGMRGYVSMGLALAAVFIVAQGAWVLAMRGKTVTLAPRADPQAQLAYVMAHPVDTAAFLVRDLVQRAIPLAHQAIGVLGWLDAPIPGLVALFLALLLVMVALGEPGPPGGAGYRWLGAAVCLVGMLALHAMNYVWWTPPNAPHVEGIQGRHFLPLIPFLFLSLSSPARIARPLARARPFLVIAFLVTTAATTVVTLLNRYYVDG